MICIQTFKQCFWVPKTYKLRTPEFLKGILILPIIGSTPSGFMVTLEQVLGLPMALLHWSVWIDLFLKVNLSEGVISNRVHFVVCYLDIMCDYVGSYR